MDRSTKQKINKEMQTLNDTIDQLDLIDIYRTFHPKTMNFTFFSSAHGTFSRIDHILGHKSNLDKLKKIEIIPSIFSDHNALRLDLNYRRKTIKISNIWRLNNTLLNNQQITEEIIIGDWNAKVGSQETPGVTGKFGLGVQNEAGQRLIRLLPKEHTGHSKHPLPTTQEKTLHRDITKWSTPKSD